MKLYEEPSRERAQRTQKSNVWKIFDGITGSTGFFPMFGKWGSSQNFVEDF
jgi:hypothetical protein